MLAVNEVPTAFVTASACLGGTGDSCAGGAVVYTGTSPGFNDLTQDDPNQPIYKLPDGVEMSLELIGIDADASMTISGVVLDSAGQTAVINTTPTLHNHPTWQLVAPGGTIPGDKHISLRLHANGFEPSAAIAVTLTLFTSR